VLVFEGLKVIDCASYIAAPAAATVMSDFGADVIKIEPLAGDAYRTPGQPLPGSQQQMNPNWIIDSRNKKSLAIDIAADEGRAVLYKLVKEADVFIINFPPRVRKKLRITYEDISALNPRLIYASFTGYGETGPEADKPGFDATVWWARSGLMNMIRAADTAPVRSPPGAGDHPSAMGFYSAIVTALYRREKTGKGAHVGSSLLANGLWANACSVQSALCGDFAQPHPPRSEHMMPWRNNYRCADGKWIMMSIVHNDSRWDTFRKAVQSPLLDDPRFLTTPDRREHGGALTTVVEQIFAQKPLAEWAEILNRHGVVFGVCYTMEDVPNDEQAKLCGALVPGHDGKTLTVSSPFWIAGEEKVTPKRAPEVGQHNEEVLKAAGYGAAEVERLRSNGIVK